MTTPRGLPFPLIASHYLGEYLEKIGHCVGLLSEDEVWWRPAPGTNSIANLMLHLAGNLSQGVFFDEGSQITLTAAPGPGYLFAGWRGDTVATGTTLQLTLVKGYDVEARFVPIVAVSVQDALQDVLGHATLSADQRSFLDELGNRNGLFDVGDLLALYRRQGLVAGRLDAKTSGARP